MSDDHFEEFKKCCADRIQYDVEAWDELVIKPLIEFGKWFKQQDSTIEWLLGGVAATSVAALTKWLGRMFAISEAEILALIIAAFAVGVGIGTAIDVLIECGEKLIPEYDSWQPPTTVIW